MKSLVCFAAFHPIGDARWQNAHASGLPIQAYLNAGLCTPNVDMNFGADVDNGTNSGLMNLQLGAPIPVFNKNQGNIAASRADLLRASREVERVENSIKARLAAVSRQYDTSLAAVVKYSNDIIPNADESLKLAEAAHKADKSCTGNGLHHFRGVFPRACGANVTRACAVIGLVGICRVIQAGVQRNALFELIAGRVTTGQALRHIGWITARLNELPGCKSEHNNGQRAGVSHDHHRRARCIIR